uniref:Ribosomal protein S14 n=1 Tax=Tsukubamonas globosa TaxID=875863 RepID=W8VKH8_9EUKA|nr:ribosomal protein S14 [Tsukubamonas globosa]BAO51956.1 ribosomal protein S14 [Tsukubamonas globosa]
MKTKAIIKDKKKRQLVHKYELKKRLLKLLATQTFIRSKDKQQLVSALNSQPRNSSIARVRNRCILTGRGNGVLTFFRLSRIKFRELASFGLLSGIKKAVGKSFYDHTRFFISFINKNS